MEPIDFWASSEYAAAAIGTRRIAGLADGGPGEEAYSAVRARGLLAQGTDVADGHRERGQGGQGRAPDVGVRREGDDGDEDEAGEADSLADDRQIGGDRQRRPHVGVGYPEVEGDGGCLEGEADEGEDDARLSEGVELRVDVLDTVGDLCQVEGARGRVHEADAHEADRGRRHRGQEELQGRFGGLPVAVPDADEGEGGQGGDFQSDDEGREVTGGGQEGCSGGGGQQQEPVLPFGESSVGVLEGGDREEGGQERAAEDQELDGEGEAVGRVAAHVRAAGQAEGGTVAVQEGQQQECGGGQACDRDPAEECLLGVADEQVGDKHRESYDGGDGGRRDGEPVDGLDDGLSC